MLDINEVYGMKFKLSPNSLNLMKECPKCFWLSQHKVWNRPAGIFPSLPSGMDLIISIDFSIFDKSNSLSFFIIIYY